MRTWLVELRCEKTQEEMAQMLGISQQMYCAIESGKRNPSVKRAKKWGKYLEFHGLNFSNSMIHRR